MAMRYIVILLLAGCATQPSYRWERAGATGSLEMDRGACESQAYSVSLASTEQQLRVYLSCMKGRGWQLTER